MKRTKRKYNPLQLISAALMVLTLCWLIVCLPVVYQAQLQVAESSSITSSPIDLNEEETGNPLTNTDEKTPNTVSSLSEEYLHEYYASHYFSSTSSIEYISKDASTYLAFHGELIVPPPDAA